MPKTRITFSTGEHLVVNANAEQVQGALSSPWGQLNRHAEGEQPSWVWINPEQVLYFEDAPDD